MQRREKLNQIGSTTTFETQILLRWDGELHTAASLNLLFVGVLRTVISVALVVHIVGIA